MIMLRKMIKINKIEPNNSPNSVVIPNKAKLEGKEKNLAVIITS